MVGGAATSRVGGYSQEVGVGVGVAPLEVETSVPGRGRQVLLIVHRRTPHVMSQHSAPEPTVLPTLPVEISHSAQLRRAEVSHFLIVIQLRRFLFLDSPT